MKSFKPCLSEVIFQKNVPQTDTIKNSFVASFFFNFHSVHRNDNKVARVNYYTPLIIRSTVRGINFVSDN